MHVSSHRLGDVYSEIVRELSTQDDSETAKRHARLILSHRTKFEWADLIASPDKDISKEEYDLIISDMKTALSGMPLSRLYGQREFWGLTFDLSKDTLDPRPDTELIVDLALQRFDSKQPLRILDLGTGSGCLIVSLLHEFTQAEGVGIDVSSGALECAQINAERYIEGDRCRFVQSSWFENVSGQYDLIVSNPPYIARDVIPTLSPQVQNHDPILALEGGVDGLQAYKIIFSSLLSFLKPSGIALFEIGYDQESDVMRLAEESGFAQRTVHVDLSGNPRVVEISSGDK